MASFHSVGDQPERHGAPVASGAEVVKDFLIGLGILALFAGLMYGSGVIMANVSGYGPQQVQRY